MSAKGSIVKMPSLKNAFRDRVIKNIFPRIYNSGKLLEDNSLKPIKLISSQTKTISSQGKTNIQFELLIPNSTADVFLYLNSHKSDMFYSIASGMYSFDIYLKNKKNMIEVFYVFNGSKSPSVFKTIIRK